MTPGEPQLRKEHGSRAAWRGIGEARYMEQVLKLRISDLLDVLFTSGLGLQDVPQIKEDKDFALNYLECFVQSQICEEIAREDSLESKRYDFSISVAFTTWNGYGKYQKPRVAEEFLSMGNALKEGISKSGDFTLVCSEVELR